MFSVNLPVYLLLGLVVVANLIAIGLSLRAYLSLRSLQISFAKLGYVLREDMKQFFSSAVEQANEAHRQSIEQNRQLIEQTMQKVLDQGSGAMQKTLAKAEAEAATIVLKAHRDAEQIRQDAREQTKGYLSQLVDHTAESVEWAMEQYIAKDMKPELQEDMIEKLVKAYLDEHQRI